MKKANAEVDLQQRVSDLVARLDEYERRLEKLDPSPKLEALQPHKIGSFVYSVVDSYARYPMAVIGYRAGRILVSSPDNPERELAIASVVPFAKCRNAEINSERAYEDMFSGMDPKARAYHEGRRKAQVAAQTSPALSAPPRQQRRYGEQNEIPFHLLRPAIGTGDAS